MAFAMIVTIIGFLLLLDKMGVISNEIWSYFWPLLIIVIGLSMMYNRMDRSACWCGSWAHHKDANHSHSSSKRGKSKRK